MIGQSTGNPGAGAPYMKQGDVKQAQIPEPVSNWRTKYFKEIAKENERLQGGTSGQTGIQEQMKATPGLNYNENLEDSK